MESLKRKLKTTENMSNTKRKKFLIKGKNISKNNQSNRIKKIFSNRRNQKKLIYLLKTKTPNSETRFLISKLFDVISLILFDEIEIDLITLMLSRLHK